MLDGLESLSSEATRPCARFVAASSHPSRAVISSNLPGSDRRLSAPGQPLARLQIGFCIKSFLREVRSPAFGSKAHPPASPATQWRATLALESRDGSRTARIYTDNFYPCE
jgi:hypothetical protein